MKRHRALPHASTPAPSPRCSCPNQTLAPAASTPALPPRPLVPYGSGPEYRYADGQGQAPAKQLRDQISAQMRSV
eukprot:2401418-Rhodomonas_salina.2